jgi:hypothetical protein
MAKARTTVDVSYIKDRANHFFRETADNQLESRSTLFCFVSTILMDANAYKGFSYLRAQDVPSGHSFGIIFDESEKREHVYPDTTRVHFI